MKYENDCVGASEPCIGLKYKKPQPHFYCDCCNAELDGTIYQTIYRYEGKDLCESCLLDAVPKIEAADINQGGGKSGKGEL